MRINVQDYLDMVHAPWGQLFYKLIWHNLNCKGLNILDFGSGLCITADFLAENNTVTAVEPNAEMIGHSSREHAYRQILGGIEALRDLPDRSFDLIVCHNVLEYIDGRRAVLQEFHRLLRENGTLSIVKHNRAGKIMQKAVFENKIDEALDLLRGGKASSVNFGAVNEYGMQELEEYIADLFEIRKICGVRTFFGLQRNEFKTEPDWVSNLYKLESAVEEVPEFRDIAYFHHIILKKQTK